MSGMKSPVFPVVTAPSHRNTGAETGFCKTEVLFEGLGVSAAASSLEAVAGKCMSSLT